MSVINSQPSPFGHLTREKHIDATCSKSWRKKQASRALLAGERSHGQPGSASSAAGPPDPTCIRRSPSPAALQGGFADRWGATGHSCPTRAWACSATAPSGSGTPGSQVLPPVRLCCKERQGAEPGTTREQALQEEAGSHPGLEVLAGLRQLCITSKAELYGLVSSKQRRAYVLSGAEDKGSLLVAAEDVSDCCFHWCGPARSCHLCLWDQEGCVVLRFCKPFRLGFGCFCCCQTEIRVFTSANQLVGTVHQSCCLFPHLLEVRDAHGLTTMTIRGSWMTSRCFSTQEFQVLSSTGCLVASIWKKWPGFHEECNMDHESFGVDIVASDLSNEERGCLLGAAFLVNFMFFEVS
ncbi:phospholipid scramblase family member 5-like [Hemicordylus capensis]|uniref:phospholipid scramblase family member 5-like n=1 Tax=Hemicordylus capensis TaxID=884348 RepID=UPI002303265E|nr:phospholipid scramblase family member 5-like [Hemicordylus capensis]